MTTLIGLLLLIMLVVVVLAFVRVVGARTEAQRAMRDLEEWEAADRELREWEYAALYERWAGDYSDPYPYDWQTQSTMPQTTLSITRLVKVRFVELPEQVPGAD